MITLLGLFLLAGHLIAAVKYGSRGGLAVSAGFAAVFPSSAIFTSGQLAISAANLIAAICGVALVVTALRPNKAEKSSFGSAWRSLSLFAAWCLLITATGPALFEGIKVIRPDGIFEDEVLSPSLLAYSLSNLAQVIYLLMGIVTAAWIAKNDLASTAFRAFIWGGLLVGWLIDLSERFGITFLRTLLDNRSDRYYAVYESRSRGTFSEPSDFGTFALVAASFFVVRLWHRDIRGSSKDLAGLILALTAAFASGSGTAFVAAPLALLCLLLGSLQNRAATNVADKIRTRPRPLIVLLVTAGTLAFLALTPSIFAVYNDGIGEKLATNSFTSRSGADALAWTSFVDSVGVGIGLGSTRPSSFLLFLLATTGIPGLILFALILRNSIGASISVPRFAPIAGSLTTLVIAKTVAGPDLSSPMLWILIGSALAAWQLRPKTFSAPSLSTRRRPSTLRKGTSSL